MTRYIRKMRREQERWQALQDSASGLQEQSGRAAEPLRSTEQPAGEALPEEVRAFMEPRFGHDFSRVRIHADAQAAEEARALNARAYTIGEEIVFGQGEYAPQSEAGRWLLAHELTHVVQQEGASGGVQGVSEREESSEQEARRVAQEVMAAREPVGAPRAVSRLGRPLLQREAHATEPDAPQPEMTALDVTGSYEALDPGGDNRITVELNQAGRHIEGWWQLRGYRSSSGAHLTAMRLSGDLTEDDGDHVTFAYRRISSGGTAYAGTLTVSRSGTSVRMWMHEGGDTIERDEQGNLVLGGWSHQFERTATGAHLSDQAIQAFPAETRALVQATENAPLDRAEEQRLADGGTQIQSLIRQYLDATRESVERPARASVLNSFIRTLMGYYAPQQMPLVIRRLREFLVNPTLQSGETTRPYWDWLQIIVSAEPSYTADIQRLLEISSHGPSDPNAPQHRYRWRFSVVGCDVDLGVGLGGFLGVFVVEKLAPDTWTAQYFTVMGTAAGGFSRGNTVGQTTAWSEIQTPFAWTSGNFRGPYLITGASVGGAAVAGPSYTPAAFINFYGDGTFPVLTGDASGWATVYGYSVGATVSMYAGYMLGGREEAIRAAQEQHALTAQAGYQGEATVHFAVDDPSLTDEGWQAIRQMCAEQRAALMNPESRLSIDGYTSTTGTVARNQRLSELRAQNTLQAIRDVLGPALALPDRQISVVGHGKMPALQAGSPDQREDQAWRKVEVSLNGQVVLTLR
jgi:outer membrane protein OmpA-like peptidoglycan-associated protein